MVLGPPNSGKSTFLASLVADILALGRQVTRVELDLASPTADLIDQAATTDAFKNRVKQEWTPQLAEEGAIRFQSATGPLVLGDAPGKIDNILEILAGPADAAIILIREDKLDSLEEWRRFADQMGLIVIAELVSAQGGISQVDPGSIPLTGRIVGLQRAVLAGDVMIRGVAERVLELSQEAQVGDP